MKIVESNGSAPEAVTEWASNLTTLSDEQFIQEASEMNQWPWDELEDLSAISGILNRIDSLLVSVSSTQDFASLMVLLDFSSLLLASAHSKSLYNSLEELLQILDLPSWPVVYKTLQLLKTLASGAAAKTTKAHKHPGLIHKLYVLGLGSNLNNPNPISLQDMCSSTPLLQIPFTYAPQAAVTEEIPANLKYVMLNRERTNASLDSFLERPLVVASQLLALSVFLQIYPGSELIQEFCKTLPEIWLLPAVSELIRTPQSVEVHVSALSLLSSILSMLESTRHEAFSSQLAAVAHDIIASWNGLMLSLLRDIAMPAPARAASCVHPEFINAVLDLASIIGEYKHRTDTSHLPAMTCSLLVLLKNSGESKALGSPNLLMKAVRILSGLLPASMDMFKEVEGMATAVSLATRQIRIYVDQSEDMEREGLKVSCVARAGLIRALLRLIKIALAKWDTVPGLSTGEIRLIVDSGLLKALDDAFHKGKYEIYEEALVLMNQMINENPSLVTDLVSDGILLSLLDSLELFIPPNPRFIEILARFLCIAGFNIDGARVLEGYNIVSKLLVALGNADSALFSNNTASSIGESLQELINTVPNTKEKVIEGCVQLAISLKSADTSNAEAFFSKISNTGKLFSQTFNVSADLMKGFISRGGLDYLLEIFRLPILPRSFNNEFYSLTACFKSLPSILAGQVLIKVMDCIRLQLQRLQDIAGPFSSITDFSQVPSESQPALLHTLTEGDCYLEIVRVILQNWAGISNNYKDFAELLESFSALIRILIAEQARLLCQGKLKDEPCDKFNISIDISIIENPELKSLVENLYFSCQLTIRRVFRLAMKIPSRIRQQAHEEAALGISRVMGEIFTQHVKAMNLDDLTFQKAYHLSLQLSDVMRVLLYEQGSTPATVLTFHLAGGTEAFAVFLVQLKKVSMEIYNKGEFSYHLVNGLQILWNLSGRFLENLVAGKYLGSNYGQQVIKALGYESSKDVMKKMQTVVLDILDRVNFLECGVISTYFAKSVLEILKVLSNLTKESPNVDPKGVKSLVDMGFGAQVARQALIATGTTSIELAMEWIFSHPEVMELPQEPEPPVPAILSSLHQKLINALPCIPSLAGSVADLLVKVANANEDSQDDIALMVLSQVGQLAESLLEESSLKEITAGMAELEPAVVPASFDQLAACLQTLQALAIKIPEILEIMKANQFLYHAVSFLSKATPENLKEHWIGSVFSIIDILIKSGEESTSELVTALVKIIEINHSSPSILLKEPEILNLLNLLYTVTFTQQFAKEFLNLHGLKMLLLCKCNKPEAQNKAIQTAWNSLIRQLCEDPFILQAQFEMSFLQAINGKVSLEGFLKAFKVQVERSKKIFDLAFANVCTVVRREDVFVEKKKDRGEINGERWGTIRILADALAEIFNAEQQGEVSMYLSSENLISLMGDMLQAYPRLIGDLLTMFINIYDPCSSSASSRGFLTHLLRTIIPFRYSLRIEDQKILFFFPNSTIPVTSSVYQGWVKAAVKLLRSMVLKQSYKQPDSPLAETYASIVLDNNAAVFKARKRVIQEIKEILSERLKKNWFENEKSVTLVRCAATILMQILREPPKAPFASNGSVELARLLCSDKYSIIKLLSEAVKGVDLGFKKASSVFNLLLAPLELLTKYSLNFTLKLSKPSEYSEAPIEVYHEENSAEESASEEIEDQEEDQEEEEENEDINEEEQLESSESAEEHAPLDDIVIESWNTEAFWADDLEEEEEEFPRRVIDNRQYGILMAERALLEQENQPHLNYRNIIRDYDENLPGSVMWGEYENDDIIQILLQRSRSNYRQELPQEPAFPRVFPDSPDYLRQLAIYYSEIAQEEPLRENERSSEEEPGVAELPDLNPPVLDPLLQRRDSAELVHEEHPRSPEAVRLPEEPRAQVPEGIDPSVLEALPEDIRNEILAQYRRPAREEPVNDEFLQALPPEIRNEIIMQQRPQARPAQDMDNATFIASLTADLRRDVLMTASEDFLSTLPPELVAEARILQDRLAQRDQYLMGRQAAPKKKQLIEEDKIIATISSDDKMSNSIPACEDSLLEVLFKGLYLSTPVSREILSSLLLNFSAQPLNRSKIIDGMVSLLLHLESKGEFPPSHLYGAESFIENYSKVYAIVSVRILDILQQLVICNPRVSLDLIETSKYRLGIIKHIRPEETQGFQDLISLMDQQLFRTSTSHLSPLISLIGMIVNKLGSKIPSLDQIAVDRLCSLLSFESLNESTVKSVVEMATKLSEMESNRQQVVKALRYQLRQIGEEVLVSLNKLETSPNGLKEIQLLRLCKVIAGVAEIGEDIDFLWQPLSQVLTSITQKETQLASTTNPVLNKLLPLIESFFISHFNRAASDTFRSFTDKNCKVINLLIRQSPNLLYDTFNSIVTKFPFLLDFENKRIYFKSSLRDIRREKAHDTIRLNLRRHEVFMDSFHQLKVKSPAEMHGKLRVQFVGEEGLDAGGVTREWYSLLSKEMFNPNYALFIPSANGVSFQPNSMSSINNEHIQFFKFIGRIIGKALCDGHSLAVYFTRSFYKHILGQEVTYQDMEDLDVDFYKSLKLLMDINLDESELHEYYFAYEEEEFGKLQVKELVPEGKTKRVTQNNKMDYIKLLCNMKMTKNIQAQIDAFKSGFHELVPAELVSIFDSKELELLISGLPTVDLEDLQANTEYHNYNENSQVIVWLWEVLNEFSREERAEFIQFVTGSSKVPIDGFKALPGIGGFQKFQIHKCFASTDRLPTAHTCMNQLDLPDYNSKEYLRNRLKLAISEGKEGFGFV